VAGRGQEAREAANAMKITAQDLIGFGIVDAMIAEPPGGAHRHIESVMQATGAEIKKFLADFSDMCRDEVREHRREKFLAIGDSLL